MKTKLPLFLPILLLAVSARAQNAPDPSSWKRFTVKKEEFSVTLPTLPGMISSKTIWRQIQKERRERWISTSVDGITYTIEGYENPKRQQSLDDFIAERAAHSNQGAKPGRDLNLNGFAGKEFSYRVDDKPATEQFFATEGRLYRFVAAGAAMDHPGVKQFFGSIKLGKKQSGIEITDGPGLPLETTTGERIYLGKEVDAKVKLQSKPHPEYPEVAKAKGVVGTVVLKAVFTAEGAVSNIIIVQGLPYGITEVCVDAAKRIKFIPARKNGKFVSTWMQLEYNFNLF